VLQRTILILFLAVAVTILTGVAVVRNGFPPKWNKIKLGMQRQTVAEIIGPGAGEWSGWSGPYWDEQWLVFHDQLHIYFDPVRGATIITVKRYL
jgi:hypothetical protein